LIGPQGRQGQTILTKVGLGHETQLRTIGWRSILEEEMGQALATHGCDGFSLHLVALAYEQCRIFEENGTRN